MREHAMHVAALLLLPLPLLSDGRNGGKEYRSEG